MADHNCLNCGSDNLQSVQEIVESGTEAKYINKPDEIPSITDILESNPDIAITSQASLAKQLSNFELEYKPRPECQKWKNIVDFQNEEELTYLKQQKEQQIEQIDELINHNIFKKIKGNWLLIFFLLLLSLSSPFFFFLFIIIIFSKNKEDNQQGEDRNKDNDTKRKLNKYQEEIKLINQLLITIEKLKIWSSLMYCPHCHQVMDFNTQSYEHPEHINKFINNIYNMV